MRFYWWWEWNSKKCVLWSLPLGLGLERGDAGLVGWLTQQETKKTKIHFFVQSHAFSFVFELLDWCPHPWSLVCPCVSRDSFFLSLPFGDFGMLQRALGVKATTHSQYSHNYTQTFFFLLQNNGKKSCEWWIGINLLIRLIENNTILCACAHTVLYYSTLLYSIVFVEIFHSNYSLFVTPFSVCVPIPIATNCSTECAMPLRSFPYENHHYLCHIHKFKN